MKMQPKVLGALGLLLAATAVMFIGLPGPEAKLRMRAGELQAVLDSREKHIDPGELQSLINNNQLELSLLDVRDENEFNLFHVIDAYRIDVNNLDDPWLLGLPVTAVKVLMSNDEARADEAWKGLTVRGVKNVYILAGGVNLWLDIFKDHKPGPAHEDITGEGDDRLRHSFAYASGHDHEASDPRPHHGTHERSFPEKVKVAGPKKSEGGGCG